MHLTEARGNFAVIVKYESSITYHSKIYGQYNFFLMRLRYLTLTLTGGLNLIATEKVLAVPLIFDNGHDRWP